MAKLISTWIKPGKPSAKEALGYAIEELKEQADELENGNDFIQSKNKIQDLQDVAETLEKLYNVI